MKLDHRLRSHIPYMCNDMNLFSEMKQLKRPQEVTLGDRHVASTGSYR